MFHCQSLVLLVLKGLLERTTKETYNWNNKGNLPQKNNFLNHAMGVEPVKTIGLAQESDNIQKTFSYTPSIPEYVRPLPHRCPV
jgi:hypothetical protein